MKLKFYFWKKELRKEFNTYCKVYEHDRKLLLEEWDWDKNYKYSFVKNNYVKIKRYEINDLDLFARYLIQSTDGIILVSNPKYNFKLFNLIHKYDNKFIIHDCRTNL
jgi:hypothetical protein